MKKILVLILFNMLIPLLCFSQNFTREAGIRGGVTSGIVYRQFLNEYLSYQGILSFRKNGIQFTLLRQIHEVNPALNLNADFRFLYGYGGHAGIFYSDKYHPFGFKEFYYPERKLSPLIGIDAYAGLEYHLDTYPIVFGVDYKPFFEFSLYQFFRLQIWDLAFNIRYKF